MLFMRRVGRFVAAQVALGVVASATISLCWGQSSDLGSAVKADSAFDAEWLLRQGRDANQKIDDEPLIVWAARKGNFELCRVLLVHGADPLATDSAGQSLSDLIPAGSEESFLLPYLIRMHALLKAHNRGLVAGIPNRPHLVTLFEPTVDYLHPEIKPYYFINENELQGIAGADDDQDGFVDNVYGWTAHLDRPYQLNFVQRFAWEEYRDLIRELLELNDRRERGEIFFGDPIFEKLNYSYRNPVAALFGGSDGYSDAEFLKRIIGLSHGSHVAGIVIRHSSQKALLHTVSYVTFGEEEPLKTDLPIVTDGDYQDWLKRYRTESLPDRLKKGHRGSDYVRVLQCGVVNGSFGASIDFFASMAESVVNELSYYDSNLDPTALETITHELYAYYGIPFGLAAAENPEVLFVVAAGNADRNIDVTGDCPSSLSRFFPNVLTVAACDSIQQKSGFSNYGPKAVNLAAPGVQIESEGIAGCRLLMSGTSMASPYVAGIAARVRAEYPDMSAPRLAQLLQLAAEDPEEDWVRFSSAGVLLDYQQVSKLIERDPAAVREMAWRLYKTDPQRRPEVWVTGVSLVLESARANPKDALLWHASAAVWDRAGHFKQALECIDETLKLQDSEPQFWLSKCMILSHQKDFLGLIDTANKFEEKFGASSGDAQARYEILKLATDASLQFYDLTSYLFFSTRSSQAKEQLRIPGQDYSITASSGWTKIEGRLRANQPIPPFQLTAPYGCKLRVELTSSDFDPLLVIQGPEGGYWRNDDRAFLDSNSEIEVEIPLDGQYTVEVSSFYADSGGSYELTIWGEGFEINSPETPLIHRRPEPR